MTIYECRRCNISIRENITIKRPITTIFKSVPRNLYGCSLWEYHAHHVVNRCPSSSLDFAAIAKVTYLLRCLKNATSRAGFDECNGMSTTVRQLNFHERLNCSEVLGVTAVATYTSVTLFFLAEVSPLKQIGASSLRIRQCSSVLSPDSRVLQQGCSI